MVRKSYCIMCGEQKDGLEVKNDRVLESIRWFKKNVTKNEKNNRLVVCKDDYTKYAAQRKRYESRQHLWLAFGIIFAVTGIILSPAIYTLIIGLIVLFFLYLLSLLNYMPALQVEAKKQ